MNRFAWRLSVPRGSYLCSRTHTHARTQNIHTHTHTHTHTQALTQDIHTQQSQHSYRLTFVRRKTLPYSLTHTGPEATGTLHWRKICSNDPSGKLIGSMIEIVTGLKRPDVKLKELRSHAIFFFNLHDTFCQIFLSAVNFPTLFG